MPVPNTNNRFILARDIKHGFPNDADPTRHTRPVGWPGSSAASGLSRCRPFFRPAIGGMLRRLVLELVRLACAHSLKGGFGEETV